MMRPLSWRNDYTTPDKNKPQRVWQLRKKKQKQFLQSDMPNLSKEVIKQKSSTRTKKKIQREKKASRINA